MKYVAVFLMIGCGLALVVLFNQPRVEEARAYQEMGRALQEQAAVAQEAVKVAGQAVQVTGQAVRGLVCVSVGLVFSQLLLLLAPRFSGRGPGRHRAVAGRPGLPSPKSVQMFNWRAWENHPWE